MESRYTLYVTNLINKSQMLIQHSGTALRIAEIFICTHKNLNVYLFVYIESIFGVMKNSSGCKMHHINLSSYSLIPIYAQQMCKVDFRQTNPIKNSEPDNF